MSGDSRLQVRKKIMYIRAEPDPVRRNGRHAERHSIHGGWLLALANKYAQYLDVIFIVALVLVLAGFPALQKGSYGCIRRAGFYTVVIATLAQISGLIVLLLGSAVLE